MSEQPDSSMHPSDSASMVKRSRPGRKQRGSGSTVSQASATTGPASVSLANQFARKMSFTPTPTPGKYPIVFPSGAGEPTRDSFIHIEGNALNKCFAKVGTEYLNSSRYAEFSANASYADSAFAKDIAMASILSMAQHVVHAHQNLGLNIGDFSAVGSTDTYLPVSLKHVVNLFGEFSVESLGTRFIMYDYESEVKALVRTAARIAANDVKDIPNVLGAHWLPVSAGDKRTTFLVATGMMRFFKRFGVTLELDGLLTSLFSGTASTAYLAVKALLPDGSRDMFDDMFKSYATQAEFVALFGQGDERSTLCRALGFNGFYPSTGMMWDIVPKVKFGELIGPWLKKKPTMTKFFTCATGSQEREVATGSPVQISEVTKTDGVTVIKSLVAVTAPEFSILACFPASAAFARTHDLNVVMSTSVAIPSRATEFLQRDWVV